MSRLDVLLQDAARDSAVRERRVPLEELREKTLSRDGRRDFRHALGPGCGEARLIAEIKRASPTRPCIRLDLNPAATARAFQRGGAAALSVLTEPRRFRGSLRDLAAARRATSLPLLRKDFITSPYMVYEAAASGADAVLLLAVALDLGALEACLAAAVEASIDVLFEVGDEDDLAKARVLRPAIVGVNARDLGTFRIDPHRHQALRDRIPPGAAAVAESGIRCAADVENLRRAGYDAVLAGEVLCAAADPASAVRRLLAKTR